MIKQKQIEMLENEIKDLTGELMESTIVIGNLNGTIEQLKQELEVEKQEHNDSVTWWQNRYNAVERDYRELKKLCDKYEEEHKTTFEEWQNGIKKVKALFPDDVEAIVISKDDYDRLTGELTYKNIQLQNRIDKAIELIEETCYDKENDIFYDDLWQELPYLLNILKGDKNE